MPSRKIILTDRQEDLVTKLVDSGEYRNASEVVRESLRLLERRKAEDALRLEAMREAVDAGIADIEAGRFYEFDTTESLRDFLSALADEAISGCA